MSKNEGKHPRGYWMSIGLSIGVAIGVALGPLFEDIGIGIAVGIAIGLGIGSALEQKTKTTSARSPNRKRQDRNTASRSGWRWSASWQSSLR